MLDFHCVSNSLVSLRRWRVRNTWTGVIIYHAFSTARLGIVILFSCILKGMLAAYFVLGEEVGSFTTLVDD